MTSRPTIAIQLVSSSANQQSEVVMTKSFGEDLKQRLIENKLCDPSWFKGCTKDEIEKIMKAQGVKRLPSVFYEYLQIMGDGGLDTVYAGSDWRCDDMTVLKKFMLKNIELHQMDFDLPEDAVVFFNHGGYDYRYFLTDTTGDDPSVYRYIEGDMPVKIADSLTQYFDMIVRFLQSLGNK
jgi:SMI1/KNR4 family protein SUKH-1